MLRVCSVAVIVALSACTETKCPECPPPPKCAACPKSEPAPALFVVENACQDAGSMLFVQARMSVMSNDGTTEVVYAFQCKTASGECVGALLNPRSISRGAPLANGELSAMAPFRVTSRTSTGYTLTASSPAGMVFTIDRVVGKVRLATDIGNFHARGEADCKP